MPAVEIAAHVPGISADSGPQSQYAILATTPTPLTPPTSTSVPSPTAVVIAEINEKAIDEVAPPQEGYLVSLDEAPEMQVIRQRSSQTWQKNPALQR